MRNVRKQLYTIVFSVFIALLFAGYFLYKTMTPVGVEAGSTPTKTFEVKQGEGFFNIVDRLEADGLVRSSVVLKTYVFFGGDAKNLKPGKYEFSSQMTPRRIVQILISGPERDVQITIPEGSTIYDIDKLLSDKKVFASGEFIKYVQSQKEMLEGRFFPDTYRFYLNSGAEEAAQKMLSNFKEKAMPVLESKNGWKENLILASLLEKEMPDFEERRIAAGILLKRMENDMPLQVDATICYMKKVASDGKENCYPITQIDLDTDSLYNTYVYKGLPKSAIANPGLSAIKAALQPIESDYWFYLSDPATKKTIFSETLDTHRANRIKYLLNS